MTTCNARTTACTPERRLATPERPPAASDRPPGAAVGRGAPRRPPPSGPERQGPAARSRRASRPAAWGGVRPPRLPPAPDAGRRDPRGAGPGGVSGLRRRGRRDPRGVAVSGRAARGAPGRAALRHRGRPLLAVSAAGAGPPRAADLRRAGRGGRASSVPTVVALVVELHTEMGVPLAKVAHLLRTTFGLQVNAGRPRPRAARCSASPRSLPTSSHRCRPSSPAPDPPRPPAPAPT